jgi:hypothetical protein
MIICQTKCNLGCQGPAEVFEVETSRSPSGTDSYEYGKDTYITKEKDNLLSIFLLVKANSLSVRDHSF